MSIKKIIVFCVLAMLPIFIFANELSGADSIETQKTLIPPQQASAGHIPW